MMSWLGLERATHDIVAAGVLYSLSSISMLLINKLAVRAFHQTFTLLALQNTSTLVLRYFWNAAQGSTAKEQDQVSLSKMLKFLPAVVCFIVMLFSSLESLAYVSIPTIIVFRNLNSLAVAFGDILILRQTISHETFLAMMVIILGSVVYGYHDLDFHTKGYIWTFVNIGAMCGYSLYVKWLMQKERMSSMSMVLYNNVLSTPVFVVVAMILGENVGELATLFQTDVYGTTFVALSCTMAFAISSTGFWAQRVFSATTWITMNNLNKIPVILLSAWIFNDQLSFGSLLGLLISILGGAGYSWTTNQTRVRMAAEKAARERQDAEKA